MKLSKKIKSFLINPYTLLILSIGLLIPLIITLSSLTINYDYSNTNKGDNLVIADLSVWQGEIDWDRASKAIDLAIIRVQNNGNQADSEPRYPENAAGAKRTGVPFGVYSYDVFKSKSEAREMATAFYNNATANGARPKFFILDIEEKTFKQENVDTYIETLREVAKNEYGERVKVGLYIANHLYKKLNLRTEKTSGLNSPDFIWVPTYHLPNTGGLFGEAPDQAVVDMWQFTSGAHIDGIKGKVDLSTLTTGEGTKISKKLWFTLDWLKE
jgi:GH25 family lysozyme M1 (1,4-beta-N-acetylmuramidase)